LDDAIRSTDLRVNASLIKPISPTELLDTVRRLFSRWDRDVKSRMTGEEHVVQVSRPVNVADDADSTYLTPAERPPSWRILMLEDNFISQQLLRDLLEKAGHSVAVASSGEEALEILEKQSFDVMLLDVQMPGMSGLEVSAQVRAKESRRAGSGHLPIVALTAHAMQGDRERCLEAGMDDYVPKPIQMHGLWAAIDHLGR